MLVGGSEVVAATLSAPLLRARYNRWGASDAEVCAPLPGDELVPTPRLGYTRAVSIDAPPAAVWPWLAQIGQGRGGLYSYDGLENLIGCRIRSVDRLLAEHQRLDVGELIRLGPPGYPCFRVHAVDPPVTLVLIGADPRPPHEAATAQAPAGVATWQWQLRPERGGRSTRLVVRQRLTVPSRLSVVWHLVEPATFVMERRMLRAIAQRAERAPADIRS